MKHTPKLFASLHGFQIAFANGVTAPVMWGENNYCQHIPKDGAKRAHAHAAEVAAFVSEGTDRAWVTREVFPDDCDDVRGHVSPAEVVHFLAKCEALPAR